MEFFDLLSAHRAEEEKLKWEGTFREYLDMVKERPYLEQTAHSRMYNMITSRGVTQNPDGFNEYTFFGDDLFGITPALDQIVEEYFHSAARRLDVKKRVLLLMGPVSGGKSTLVALLKKGMEKFSKTDEGAIYGIKGCPMHESPMHLVPEELRSHIKKEYGVIIEGDLCPVCRHRVKEEFGGKFENMTIERIFLSEKDRVGVGTFVPSDEKDQDLADLTGSADFATIAEYGSESDPRAYRFDGELNIANRGVMEFQEILKVAKQFLWCLLSLTQEGNFKAGRFALISADEVVVAHTNEPEYTAFIADKSNEALQSRMIIKKIPYNLRLDDEVKIYEKLIGQSDLTDVHIAPYALKMAGMFSILTRLKKSQKSSDMSLLTKLKLYNGEAADNHRLTEVRDLILEGQNFDEGMSGIDPRYIINRISAALIKNGTKCINPIDVLRALKDGLDQHPSITREEKDRYLDFIHVVRAAYDDIVKNEVQKSFVYSYPESSHTLLTNYLDNIEAYIQDNKLRDQITGDLVAPDERLMRAIEEQIGVTESTKKAFREEIMLFISSYHRHNNGKAFEVSSHPRLEEAINKKLFADMRDIIKVTTSTKTPDAEQLKRINVVIERLVEENGYCPICANEVLKYAGSLLSK